MTNLITGHKGLIGNALFKHFNAIGFDKGDTLIDQKYDLIIHAAANCVIRETIESPSLAKENIDLTFKIFELARKHKSKLVVFSSGRVSHEVFNPYTVSKRFNETMARAYKDCYGLDTLVIRPETVWGRSLNNKRAVITWIEAAKKNEPLIIYGDENKELPPIHINEFTQIVLGLIENFESHKNKTITVSGQIRKASDIAESIIKMTGSKSQIVFKDPELTQPQRCEPSDYTSDVSFEESLKLYLEEI